MHPCKGSLLSSTSYLYVLLKVITDQLEHLKEEKSVVEFSGVRISLLKDKHDITLGTHGSTRSRWSSITMIAEYRNSSCNSMSMYFLKILRPDLPIKPRLIQPCQYSVPPYYPLRIAYHHMATRKLRYLLSSMEKKQKLSTLG